MGLSNDAKPITLDLIGPQSITLPAFVRNASLAEQVRVGQPKRKRARATWCDIFHRLKG